MKPLHLGTSALLAGLLCQGFNGQAQSLLNGFFSGKGHGSVVVSGTTESYHNVFLVPEKVDGVPVFRRITINSVSLYGTYGFGNKVEGVLSVPYIRSAGEADSRLLNSENQPYANSRGNFQDVTGLLKFKAFSRDLGSSVLDLTGAVGLSTPLGNYKQEASLDYIVAIGNRATKFNTVGVAQLKMASGVFVAGQAGYSLRSGRVPNAFVAETKLGYAGPRLYLDAWADFQQSNSGTDILQPGFDNYFPATRVNYTRVGVSGFRPIAKGLGLSLAVSTYVAGRNVGQSTAYSVGVAYNF